MRETPSEAKASMPNGLSCTAGPVLSLTRLEVDVLPLALQTSGTGGVEPVLGCLLWDSQSSEFLSYRKMKVITGILTKRSIFQT